MIPVHQIVTHVRLHATLVSVKRMAPRVASLSMMAFGLLALGGCQREMPADDANGPAVTVTGTAIEFAAPPHGIRTAPSEDAGQVALLLPGRLAWDEDRTVRVFTPFSGRVVRLLVQAGDAVTRNQPLAEIASPDYDQAQADARSAATKLTLATQAHQRALDLNAAGVVALKDLEQAEADFQLAEAERVRAQSRLQQVGAAGGQNFLLKAPIAGVVVEKAVNPGQELRADQSGAPFFVITDPTHLWVWLDASETNIRALANDPVGTRFDLSSAAYPERKFVASVRHVVDFVDPTSRTFRLRGEVDNSERLLKGEMFVTATLPLSATPSAQDQRTINAAAVLSVGDRQYVFVQDSDRKFSRVEVQIAREQVGRTNVTALPGDKDVVIEGNLFLEELLEKQSTSAPTPDATSSAVVPMTSAHQS